MHIGILAVHNFALVPFACAIETLRMANQVSGKTLYNWTTLSMDGKAVQTRSGLSVTPDQEILISEHYDAFFVSGGTNIEENWSKKLEVCLKQYSRNNVLLGAFSTGSFLLAKAGVLNGYKCTTHWSGLASMRENFPRVNFTDRIYEIDRDRCTCAGGTTAIDMMLHIIGREHGQHLSEVISDNLLLERTRNTRDRQCIPLRQSVGTSQPKLSAAADLMANNIEEPLSADELAGLVNTSKRHLERLFSTYLNCSPMNYYLDVRLQNARRLLQQTEMSNIEVSLACGFTSATYFSKCYKKKYGLSPKCDRSSQSFWDKK